VKFASPVAPRARVLVASVIAVLVGALLALGVPAQAFADAPVSFTIQLTNKAGAALTNWGVDPIAMVNGAPSTGASLNPFVGSGGTYTGTLLANTTYTFAFVPTGSSSNSTTVQFLGGSPNITYAETVTPTPGNRFINVSIATGGAVVGTVTAPTGKALAGAEVDEYEYDGTDWVSNDYTIANSHGQYSFTDVDPGSYKFAFYANGRTYPTTYSGGVMTLAAARETYVSAGATATVNQKMLSGTGSIYGTALDDFEGKTFGQFKVIAGAFPVTAQSLGVASAIDTDGEVFGPQSNTKGQWTVGGLKPGAYVVQLRPWYGGETAKYLGSGGDGTSLSQATIFTLAAGQKVNAGTSITQVGDDCVNEDANCGGELDLQVFNSSGTVALPGLEAQLSITTDPFSYVSATVGDSGTALFSFGDGTPVDASNDPLEPGWYTLTVIDPEGQYEPVTMSEFLGFGVTNLTLDMQSVTTAPAIAQPTIAHADTVVGTEYVVTGATPARSDATVDYQWYRDGSPIFGATDSSYTSVGGDVGKQLSVIATANSFGFDPVHATAYVGGDVPTVETEGATPVNTIAPTVSPVTSVYVGTTLQANVGGWNLDNVEAKGLTYSYVWDTGTGPVESGSSYVVQPTDVGSPVTVTVTASKPGFASSAGVASSDSATPVLRPAPGLAKAPTVTAKVSHGVTTYSVSSGTWNTAGLSYTYLWTIGAETFTTQSLGSSLLPHLPSTDPLTVVVTAHKVGYADGSSVPLVAVRGTNSFFQAALPDVIDTTTGADVTSSTTNPLDIGDHLTIHAPGVWAPVGGISPDSLRYQWYRNGVAIAGANTANYTIVAADTVHTAARPTGALIGVVETAVSSRIATTLGDTSVSDSSVGIGTAIALTPPAVTLHGASAVGQTLSATAGSWGTVVTQTYQWYACVIASCTDASDSTQYSSISGATKSTLLLSAKWSGVYLKVNAAKAGYLTTPAVSSLSDVQPPAVIVPASLPTISGATGGQAHVGAKLTAVASKWAPSGVATGYVWQTQQCTPGSCDSASWTDTGDHTSTYTPGATDYLDGNAVRVEVTGTKTGSMAVRSDSVEFAVGLGASKATALPTLSASTSAFTLKPGKYAPAGGTTILTWSVDGVAGSSGTPTPYLRNSLTNAGKSITALVTYSVPGYPEVVTSLVAQKGATTTDTTTSIVGSHYGQTLALSVQHPFSDAESSVRPLTYQWYSNGVAIKGATAATFTPSSGYVGRKITARVAVSSADYASASFTTAGVTLVAGTFGAYGPPAAQPSNPSITVTGAVVPGTVLTATPASDYVTVGVNAAPGLAFSYQWQRSTNSGATWSSIGGATSAHYTVAAADVTEQLRVLVTAHATGFTSLALTSDAETVQYSPTLATIAPPTLAAVGGTPKVGALLTAAPGVWNAAGLTYTYAWYRNGKLIPSVTGTTWLPTSSSFNDDIVVEVTASGAGYQPVEVDSAHVQIGAGAAPSPVVAPVITVNNGVFTISNISWSVDGLTVTFDWGVNNDEGLGTGQGTNAYTPRLTESGPVTVVITATRHGYETATFAVNGPSLP
jgi:hypothetical protein